MTRKNFKFSLIFTALVGMVAAACGVYFFGTQSGWAIGEIGDYFGGVLGGCAFILLVATGFSQLEQIQDQRRLGAQQTTLHALELAKPDLEDLSWRIAIGAGLVVKQTTNGTPGKRLEYEERFNNGQRTEFFKLIWAARKKQLKTVFVKAKNRESGRVAADRFIDLFESILKQAGQVEDQGEWRRMLLSMEVGHAYRGLKTAKGEPTSEG